MSLFASLILQGLIQFRSMSSLNVIGFYRGSNEAPPHIRLAQWAHNTRYEAGEVSISIVQQAYHAFDSCSHQA